MISILDCTLRDGGYVNNWRFDSKSVLKVIQCLNDSGTEIIEAGYISHKNGKEKDSTKFNDILTLNNLLLGSKSLHDNVLICAMFNLGEYDVETLPQYDPQKYIVRGLRVTFHGKDVKKALEVAKIVIQKGYHIFLQPMVTMRYSEEELLSLIEAVNNVNPYAMYIVDSFGTMINDDLINLHDIFEKNLNEKIKLGFHSHNNLQNAYFNAISFLNVHNQKRDIIIDSSLLGMGRGAGNLHTELLADHLNKYHSKEYDMIPILEIIDNYIESIKKKYAWGYSLGHFLSASIGCHPNYATHLINKKNLSIVSIQKILNKLQGTKKIIFDIDHIDDLVFKFKSSHSKLTSLPNDLFKDKDVLILASGASIKDNLDRINKIINNDDVIVICANHNSNVFNCDYAFFSNQKRYEEFYDKIDPNKIIITSNIIQKNNQNNCSIVDYKLLAELTSYKNDNVTVLILNLLSIQEVKSIYIAGFDGYNIHSNENYSYDESAGVMDIHEMERQNRELAVIIKELKGNLNLEFITPSLYDD